MAKYAIFPLGIANDTVGDVVIDNRIALIQPHTNFALYLCPLRPNPHPTAAEAWFYCDCIAYEHDIPAIVYPTPSEFSEFKYRYAHSGSTKPRIEEISHWGTKNYKEAVIRRPLLPSKVTRAFLMDHLLGIFNDTREIRHGPLTYVIFGIFRQRSRVHLDYSKWYGNVIKEIGLFSAALRQPDFLAEYLGYYRVIEAATQTNGKSWITSALERFSDRKWPPILLGHETCPENKPRNILGIYRRKASARLKQLRKQFGSNEEVARYLYNVQRCGIAHGGGKIVLGNISPTYFEVARDAVILKLLARMAIEEKRL